MKKICMLIVCTAVSMMHSSEQKEPAPKKSFAAWARVAYASLPHRLVGVTSDDTDALTKPDVQRLKVTFYGIHEWSENIQDWRNAKKSIAGEPPSGTRFEMEEGERGIRVQGRGKNKSFDHSVASHPNLHTLLEQKCVADGIPLRHLVRFFDGCCHNRNNR